MESLHNRIMNIPDTNEGRYTSYDTRIAFKEGHRDARHAAAELAVKHDAALAHIRNKLDLLIAAPQLHIDKDDLFEALQTIDDMLEDN